MLLNVSHISSPPQMNVRPQMPDSKIIPYLVRYCMRTKPWAAGTFLDENKYKSESNQKKI